MNQRTLDDPVLEEFHNQVEWGRQQLKRNFKHRKDSATVRALHYTETYLHKRYKEWTKPEPVKELADNYGNRIH